MLHTFLYLHLDATFVLSDVERHLPESSGNQFTEDDGHRREQQQCPCQPLVKPAHQQEGTTEFDTSNQHFGQGIGCYLYHLFNILSKS